MKIINDAKVAGGNRPLKVQTPQEKRTAEKLVKKSGIKYATVIIEMDGELWACKMLMSRLMEGLAISGEKAKILCPFGKKQFLQLVDDGDRIELIGYSDDLDEFRSRKGVSNNGHAIEYYLAKKYHAKFDHFGSMATNGGEFRGTEVKFFSFDKTTGTPSATVET